MKNLPKYHKDREFEDPVMRCDGCGSLVSSMMIKKLGMCSCGNRRFKNVQGMSEEEMTRMKEWKIDPDFLALFEVTFPSVILSTCFPAAFSLIFFS